ncbi:MAG: sulfurtransferase TusA family protein [Magnetococcales bacterium]|nr:sulfurtransferase TusA family protein [Magnetococcales bacterium]
MSKSNKPTPDKKIDAKNLLCPLPILRADAAMLDLEIGQTLEIQATDPGLVNDLPAWCSINSHKILEMKQQGRLVIGLVEKGE